MKIKHSGVLVLMILISANFAIAQGMRKSEIIQKLGAMEKRLTSQNKNLSYVSVIRYSSLAVERRQDGQKITIWSDAIDKALAENDGVYFPAAEAAYYIDRPIVMESGMHIRADKSAVIRCVEGMLTCMVRNKNIVSGIPIPLDEGPNKPDSGISINGGIWDHAKSSRGNGGHADAENSVPGAYGVFLFSNILDLVLTDMKMMHASCFATAIAYGENLLISDIYFENMFCDGIHITGPYKNIIVKNILGETGDDIVALNAWDWDIISTNNGPIDCAWIKNINQQAGHRAIRLFPGIKTYINGSVRACPVTNVVIENISGVREFKAYAQPEPGNKKNTCAVGKLDYIYFEDIEGGYIHIHANAGHLFFKDIRGKSPIVKVGPKSGSLPCASCPEGYREMYLPDTDCVVGSIILKDFPKEGRDSLVEEIQMILNPDYPKTTPKGGTGNGKVHNIIYK